MVENRNEALYDREWVHAPPSENDRNNSLCIMQFNILADGLCGKRDDKGQFDRSPADSLDWDYRKDKLLEEIQRYEPDILCCQEIDHFEDFFKPELHGYEAYFAPKPHSKCQPPDGCAIFCRSAQFKSLSHHVLTYSNGNQLALIVEATTKNENRTIRIVTTHLKAQKDEKGEQIRFDQTKELIQHLSQLSSCPTLIAGDFNATPSSSKYFSKAYPFVAETFRSSYVNVIHQEPEYSTWKSRHKKGVAKHTIDYIWYSPQDWHVHAVLDVPAKLDNDLLPSFRYGSDHLALCARLSLI